MKYKHQRLKKSSSENKMLHLIWALDWFWELNAVNETFSMNIIIEHNDNGVHS